jgi:hypothetical protein
MNSDHLLSAIVASYLWTEQLAKAQLHFAGPDMLDIESDDVSRMLSGSFQSFWGRSVHNAVAWIKY